MKPSKLRFTGVLVVVTLVALVWWFARSRPSSGSAETSESAPVARVTVSKIERKTIVENAAVYGTVVAQPGMTHSVSVSFEARVRQILVAPGQYVEENEPLIEIEASPAAQLQLQQARNALEATRKELAQTQKRFDMKLATNQELGAAQKAARDAELQMESLQKQGVGTDNRIRSDKSGVVSKVDVQVGQLVPASGVLVEIVSETDIEVKLGVEPADIAELRPGQGVALFPVNSPAVGRIDGKIRLITRRVDPATRLVDVYVSVPPETRLLLDGYVRAEIAATAQDALVVPRSAVLPEDGGFSLFTIADGHAKKHLVKTGLEGETEVQIIGSGISEGESVITSGNYEISDGMAVEVRQ